MPIVFGKKDAPVASNTNPLELINRRFIKLKSGAEVGKVECTRKAAASDKKKQLSATMKSTDEMELSLDTSHTQSQVYTPSATVSQVLSVLIEAFVRNFNDLISECTDEKKVVVVTSEVFPYQTLLKVLALLCSEHPLLLLYILNYNCAPFLNASKDKKSQAKPLPSFLEKYAEKGTFTFLSYYLRVVNLVALDKLRYFLVSISTGRDTMISRSDGSVGFISEEVAREILTEARAILQNELARPDFLESPSSVQNFCSVSSLIIAFLPIPFLLKLILEEDPNIAEKKSSEARKEPAILTHYVEALKRLRLKNYYKLENVLPFIIQPCSALIQYYNYVILRQPSFNLDGKMMPGNILAKHDFRLLWEQMLAAQAAGTGAFEEIQPQGQNQFYYEEPSGRNIFSRALGDPREDYGDEEDYEMDIDYRGDMGWARGTSARRGRGGGLFMAQQGDLMRAPPQRAVLRAGDDSSDGEREMHQEVLSEEESLGSEEEDDNDDDDNDEQVIRVEVDDDDEDEDARDNAERENARLEEAVDFIERVIERAEVTDELEDLNTDFYRDDYGEKSDHSIAAGKFPISTFSLNNHF